MLRVTKVLKLRRVHRIAVTLIDRFARLKASANMDGPCANGSSLKQRRSMAANPQTWPEAIITQGSVQDLSDTILGRPLTWKMGMAAKWDVVTM